MRLIQRLLMCAPLLALVAIVIGLPGVALGRDDANDFRANFRGINETPSISTDATASLRLRINGSGNDATIDYTFTFAGLRAPVTQAHIHFGQTRVMGGVMVFLCGTAASPGPAGTPSCTTGTNTMSGSVTRTLHASDVIGPNGQGIAAGEMGRVVQAIRDGAAYGNVHSTQFPAGEARGQLVSIDN